MDEDSGLVVGSGGEDLALAGGDDGVAGNELGQTLPVVSIPTVRGQTSTGTTSSVPSSPERRSLWTAAPQTTASSALIPLEGSLPKYSLRSCWTLGIRVEPPTRTT